MAAGVVPQSSCSLRPTHPATTCSTSASGRLALPLPRKPTLSGSASAACSMRETFLQVPGVQVVALVPAAGPVPPPIIVVTARADRLLALLGRDEMDVRVDAARREQTALARDDLGARADDDVDAGLDVRVAGLADAGDAAVLDADVGLDDAPGVDDDGVRDDGVGHRVDRRPSAVALGSMPSRMTLPPPNLDSPRRRSCWSRSIWMTSSGVAEANLVAHRGAVPSRA